MLISLLATLADSSRIAAMVNGQAEMAWTIIGFNRLAFIDSAAPLGADDTRALEALVKSAEGTPGGQYTSRLEGKLAWDRLIHGAAGTKVATATALSRSQAQGFHFAFATEHPEWLCPSLVDAETVQALRLAAAQVADGDRETLSTRLQEKCGKSL